jgi:hypothetical protein
MFRLKYLPHKEPDEKIIFFLHRHSYVIWRYLVLYFFVATLPPLILWIGRAQLVNFMQEEVAASLIKLLFISFYLFWWLMLYHSWLDYFLDIWIVTNHRVLNIEQRGLFNRAVAEHKLFRIQDVMSEQKGIIPTFLDYGEIHIQTASSEKIVVFKQVPKPHHVARQIIKLVEHHKKIMAKVMEKMDKAEGID